MTLGREASDALSTACASFFCCAQPYARARGLLASFVAPTKGRASASTATCADDIAHAATGELQLVASAIVHDAETFGRASPKRKC